MDNLTPSENKIVERLLKVWSEACARYLIDDDEITKFKIEFVENKTINRITKRPTAAHISLKNTGEVTVLINRLAVKQNAEDILSETVPHEIAHLVCFLRPHMGGFQGAHDDGWKRIVRALGGRGDVQFKEEYKLASRTRKRYVYLVPGIGRVEYSDVQHNRIQKGISMVTKRERVQVLKEHWTGEVAK